MRKTFIASALSCALSLPALANMEQAISAYNSGNLEQAAQLIEQVEADSANKYLYLSKISLKNSKLDQAEDYIDKAISLAPDNGDLHFFYSTVMAVKAENAGVFSQIGYAKNVLKGFTAAVKYSPNNVKYRESLMAFHLAAPGMLGGDTYIALEQAQAVQAMDALAGVTALMQVYAVLEQQTQLDDIYRKATEQFGDEPEVHYQMGMNYVHEEDYSNARIALNKAMTLPATSDRQHQAKYMAMYQIGRASVLTESHFDEGESALNEYINNAVITESMPEAEWAKYRLANIVEFKGDKVRAKALYQEIQQKTLNNELRKKAKKKAKKLG